MQSNSSARALAIAASLALTAALIFPIVSADFAAASSSWLPSSLAEPVQGFLRESGVMPRADVYLLEVVQRLFSRSEYLLAAVVLVYAIGLPILSLGGALALAFGSSEDVEQLGTRLLRVTAQWSMTNAFVVAWFIVFVAADSLRIPFSPAAGTYCYIAAAILCSAAARAGERRASGLLA